MKSLIEAPHDDWQVPIPEAERLGGLGLRPVSHSVLIKSNRQTRSVGPMVTVNQQRRLGLFHYPHQDVHLFKGWWSITR